MNVICPLSPHVGIRDNKWKSAVRRAKRFIRSSAIEVNTMALGKDDYTTSWVLGGGLLLVYAASAIIRRSTRKVDENGKELKHPPG